MMISCLRGNDAVFELSVLGTDKKAKIKPNKNADFPCIKTLYNYLARTPQENRHGAIFINPLTKRRPKEIKRAWKTAKRKARIENFRFHDIRHTVATRLVNAGVPLPTVQKVITHSDITTTML